MMELRKRKPVILKKQIVKKRSLFDKNPFNHLPTEMIAKINESLSPAQIYKNRSVCRRLHSISKMKEYKPKGDRHVILFDDDKGFTMQMADDQGKFDAEKEYVYDSLDELARFAGRPIEKLHFLFLDFFLVKKVFLAHFSRLLSIVRKYKLRANDVIIYSESFWIPDLKKQDTETFYKVLRCLKPKSLVFDVDENFSDMHKAIRENKTMFNRLDFFLVKKAFLAHFSVPIPRFIVKSVNTLTEFFDYKSVVQQGQPKGPYNRIPSLLNLQNPFEIIPDC